MVDSAIDRPLAILVFEAKDGLPATSLHPSMLSSSCRTYPSLLCRDMIIVGEKVLLYSVHPISWLVSQTPVVFLHLGDDVLVLFNLPRSHFDGAELGGGTA